MSMPSQHFRALTVNIPTRANRIISDLTIAPAFDPAKPPSPFPKSHTVKALWDTGATGSCIFPSVAAALNLAPTGTAQLQSAADASPVLNPDQRLREIAAAYRSFAQHSPDYFRLLTALDRGDFQESLSEERRAQLADQSRRALDLVREAFADGIALRLFRPGDPRHYCGILWATLNGAMVLVGHPLRRGLLTSDPAKLYDEAVEMVLRGARVEEPGR